jgi:hypothetical protein
MPNKAHGSVEVGKHNFVDNSSVEEAGEESYPLEERVPLKQHMGEWNSAALQVSTSEQECTGERGLPWSGWRWLLRHAWVRV